ncbi:sodium-dependent dopamine transporter-like isoform X1 [Oratosquilla oratoria]|uniref:sodium-dependent dopamine transporter-like isoform X1 n=2 Tax=Oratosquilla oratoria TaxID=337810 RepID=UPI003F775363
MKWRNSQNFDQNNEEGGSVASRPRGDELPLVTSSPPRMTSSPPCISAPPLYMTSSPSYVTCVQAGGPLAPGGVGSSPMSDDGRVGVAVASSDGSSSNKNSLETLLDSSTSEEPQFGPAVSPWHKTKKTAQNGTPRHMAHDLHKNRSSLPEPMLSERQGEKYVNRISLPEPRGPGFVGRDAGPPGHHAALMTAEDDFKRKRGGSCRKSTLKKRDWRRSGPEKGKSVTIVVDAQQACFDNTAAGGGGGGHSTIIHVSPDQPQLVFNVGGQNGPSSTSRPQMNHSNGSVAHSTSIMTPMSSLEGSNGHAVTAMSELESNSGHSRHHSSPSSTPGTTTSSTGDPDVKVTPILGASWRDGKDAGSLLGTTEDGSSTDDFNRSTLNLVTSPAKTLSRAVSVVLYLSGEGLTGQIVDDIGEQWRSWQSCCCGISLVLGSATFYRLPALLCVFPPGPFLVAYLAVVVTVGLPLVHLDAALAQFGSCSLLLVWRLAPVAKGVGWAAAVLAALWTVWTLGALAPLLHYIIHVSSCTASNAPSWCPAANSTMPPMDYFRLVVYNMDDTWHNNPDLSFSWPLVVAAMATLLAAVLSTLAGPTLFCCVSALFALLALLGAATQLGLAICATAGDAAMLWNATRPFLTFRVEALADPQLWASALSQGLLSLGLGVGMLANASSRNAFRYPLRRHLCVVVMVVLLAVVLVTLLATLQIAVLRQSSQELENNATTFNCGIMSAVTRVGVPHILATEVLVSSAQVLPSWTLPITAIVVFVGLWSAGACTVLAGTSTLLTVAREDRDPGVTSRPVLGVLGVVTVLAVGVLPCVSKVGAGLTSLLDIDVIQLVLFWPILVQILAITAIYGMPKVCKDLTFMLETQVSRVWIFLWSVLVPAAILGVIIWTCVIDGRNAGVLDGPIWRAVGVWTLRALVVAPVFVTAARVVHQQLAYGCMDKLVWAVQSSREWGDWGPQDPIEHHNWRKWREDEIWPVTSLQRRLNHRPPTYTHSTLRSHSHDSTLTRLRSKYSKATPPLGNVML